MPLDPAVKVLLDQIDALGAPGMHELPPADVRAMYESLRVPGLGDQRVPTTDTAIDGPHGEIPVRVYTPPTGEAPWPVIVFFHGGGWVIGSIETHDGVCRDLAARVEAVVVSVDYRLAPEDPFPAPLDDACAAVEWVAAKAADLGGDPARLAVVGDSAGGNLAAAVCLLARDRGGPSIAFQVLVYPVTDLTMSHPSMVENGEGYMLTAADMRYFAGHYLADTDATDWRCSPLHAEDHAGLPPALVQTAEFDPLRDEGEAYAERLREAGVPVEVRRFDGLIHGYLNLRHLVPAAEPAVDHAVDALRRALH